MEQLSIFSPPRARKRDPLTSHRAAAKVNEFAESHRSRILAAMTEPVTPREIAERTGMDYVAVQRRMKEIQTLGLAELTGEQRDGCRVWRLA